MASDISEAEIGSIKMPKTAKTAVVRVSNDYVFEHFDLEKLACSNEVTGDFDVSFRWCRLAAGMVVRYDDCGGTRHNG